MVSYVLTVYAASTDCAAFIKLFFFLSPSILFKYLSNEGIGVYHEPPEKKWIKVIYLNPVNILIVCKTPVFIVQIKYIRDQFGK